MEAFSMDFELACFVLFGLIGVILIAAAEHFVEFRERNRKRLSR